MVVDRHDNGKRPIRRGRQVYPDTIDYATAGRQVSSEAPVLLLQQRSSGCFPVSSGRCCRVRRRGCMAALNCEMVSAGVRAAGQPHTCRKDKDLPSRCMAEVHLTDKSRDSVAVLLPEGIEAARPSLFALQTWLLLATKKPHAARARDRSRDRRRERSNEGVVFDMDLIITFIPRGRSWTVSATREA